jgi:hypothetical protein
MQRACTDSRTPSGCHMVEEAVQREQSDEQTVARWRMMMMMMEEDDDGDDVLSNKCFLAVL